MRVEIQAGKKLDDLNARLGTGVVRGGYTREVASMGRVAGRPRRVAFWNFVDADGQVVFRMSAADYEAFVADGVIRAASP